MAVARNKLSESKASVVSFESVRDSASNKTIDSEDSITYDDKLEEQGDDRQQQIRRVTEKKIEELYETSEDLNYDIDSSDEVDFELIVGYGRPRHSLDDYKLQ